MNSDFAVVGGGPGGYVAAIRAAQRGRDTVLVEREAVGGVCLNHGCIPSKALVAAAERMDDARTAGRMGIEADPELDFATLGRFVDGTVTRLTRGVEQLLDTNGAEVLAGTASFTDSGSLAVPEAEVEIDADRVVLATGSRPIELPGFDFSSDPILSSRDLFALDSLPGRLVVVGAGYVGMELATALAKLGVDVTVLEAESEALPGFPNDLAVPARKGAEAAGVEFAFEAAATGWNEVENGVEVRAETSDDDLTYSADAVLVAVGRTPVTDTIARERIGLGTDERGFFDTVGVEGVVAVGDCAGPPMLAHKAMREGELAAEGEEGALGPVPEVVFTDPEIARVGNTDSEGALVGECPFRANGRALAGNDREGFVRVVADAGTRRVRGASVVGPEATELVAELGLAVSMGATLDDVAATVHAHPTLAEAVREAALAADGRAVHTANR